MKFADLVLKNRSMRTYDESRKITEEELVSLVELARISPSASNRQPLKYFLSCDDETNAIIQPLTGWAGLLPQMHLPPVGHQPTAFIVILADKTITPNVSHADKDVGIVAQTMLLGATEMGLSGCMIGSFRPELKAALDLPENLEVALVIAFGKGEEQIEIVDAGESVKYYRDEAGIHYVPKRTLGELIIKRDTK
jgi:nitroreductase